MILNIVDIPLLICRRVGLDVKKYFLSVALWPALHILPFAACLVGARLIFCTDPLIGLICGGGTGGIILALLYWRCVLPESIRMRLKARLLCRAG
jgi:hypothetical protein